MNRRLGCGFFLFVALVLMPAASGNLAAQVIKGSISGAVVDPQGAAISDAVVRVVNTGTNEVFTTQSDSAGLFRLSLLPVGLYRVEITKSGFRKMALTNVDVSVGQDRGLGPLKLELGEVAITVEVTAAPPLVQSSQAQVSTVISFRNIESFPGVLENQGLDVLALFVPGVVDNRDLGFSNTNGTGFGVNGIRGRNNDQQVDGQNNNDNSVAGPYLFLSNPEFVQEYQITTSNFGPEYGRNSGSVVNIVTRQGTNTWHGSIFGTEANSVLNTLSNTQKAFESLKKVSRFNEEFTGATIGGPWLKDKIFFFGGFDNDILSRKRVFATGLQTPTPTGLAQLTACFPNSASVAALRAFGPYGVAAGNPQPSGTIATRAVSIDGTTTNVCNVQFAGVQRVLPSPTHSYDWIGRIDIQGAKDHLYARYIFNKLTEFNRDPNFSVGNAASGYPFNVPSLSQDIGISWARTVTSRMANELRLSFGRLNVQFGGNGIGNTIPTQGNVDQALARVDMPAGFLGFAPPTNTPQGRIVNTYQVQDNWSYFVGRHQLKAGVNFTYQRSPNIFLPNLNGRFLFNSFSNFARNRPTSARVALGTPSLDFREKDTFVYFGDDLKVTGNFTLNLGITWSYYGQPANLFHDITTKRESNASTALWNPSLPLAIRTFPEIPAPKNSWGPSAGFAWSPGGGGWLTGGAGKTVLRGGYRLTYDPPFYNIYINISSSTPQVFLQTLTGSTALANPLPAAPFGPTVRAELAPFLTPGVFDPRTFNETTITPDFGPQRTHQWSFGIQRQIVPKAVFEARYVGNHATNLFQSINANPLISTIARDFPTLIPSGVTPCPASQAVFKQARGRVHCDQGVVRQRTNTAFSDYNGLQLEFRADNLARQLTVKTGYTFSKTTDNVSEIFGTGAAGNSLAFAQNALDFTKAEHGLSGLDFRHRWTLAFTEELPFFRAQRGVPGKILGGWAVSGTYVISSGQPYTPVQFCLSACSGSPYDDGAFDTAFAGTFELARPFLSSSSAPASAVGIFAGDACNIGFGPSGDLGCSLAPSTLISLNALNATTPNVTAVSKNDVRFIVNGLQAQTTFNTPFGTAGRNVLRDYHTNVANFSLLRTVKFGERTRLRWHMTIANVFNHPNFSSIDPFIDDAGLATEFTGFANPQLFSGSTLGSQSLGQRQILFGLRVSF